MGKAKRKINRLKRKFLKKKVKIRIPTPKSGYVIKSKKDYDRNSSKQEAKKIVSDES